MYFLDSLLQFVSFPGSNFLIPVGLFFAILGVFYYYNCPKHGFVMLLLPFSYFYSLILKLIFHTARPSLDNITIFTKADMYGFPSSHVTYYTVFFGYILYECTHNKSLPRVIKLVLGGISIFMLSLVGVSRVYLRAHTVTDVIGGYLFGSLYLVAIILLERPLAKNSVAKNQKNNH